MADKRATIGSGQEINMNKKTDCRTFSRITEKDAADMDSLIEAGFALNRSDFTRQAIKHYVEECNSKKKPRRKKT